VLTSQYQETTKTTDHCIEKVAFIQLPVGDERFNHEKPLERQIGGLEEHAGEDLRQP